MIRCMINRGASLTHRPIAPGEPNRRQQLALERIEFAVGELASVLMSSCRSDDTARVSISDIRKAVTPVLAAILADD